MILLTKCQIDKWQISIPKMSVLIVAFLKEKKKKKKKKKNRVEREEENKLPNHSLT